MPQHDEPTTHDDRREPVVASVTGALLHSWWLIALFVAVGIAGAALFTLAGDDTYSATASVYIGQTTDANGNVMAGLDSNARAAIQLIDSDAVRQQVAEEIGGMTAAELRRQTSVETPSQTVRTTQSVVSFVVITVTDDDPELAAAAANAFGDELLARITPASEQRLEILEAQERQLSASLEASRERSRRAESALEGLDGGDAVAAAPYLAILQAAATEQLALVSSLQKAQLMLQVATTTERPRLLHEAAVPDATRGADLPLNVAAGALAGLVVGIVVAFVRARHTRVA